MFSRLSIRDCSALVVAAALAAAGCTDTSPVAPQGGQAGASSSFDLPEGTQCETVDFSGFSHADALTSLSLFGGSVNLSLTAERRTSGGGFEGSTVDPLAYNTEEWSTASEAEADGVPSGQTDRHRDTQKLDPFGLCDDCDGPIVIVPDEEFSTLQDQNVEGGRITITGFSGSGTFAIPSYDAVDDDADQTMSLEVDGTEVGASEGAGDAEVETVMTDGHTLSETAEFTLLGSGGIDNVEVCKLPRGDEGCTPGFWRQPHHFDSWPSDWLDTEGQPDVDFCGDVFTCPSSLALRRPESGDLNDISLLEALVLRGGGVNALARHAAAAALNARGDTGVDYFFTFSEVVSMVNAALESGDYETTKDDLEEANEAVCPLD